MNVDMGILDWYMYILKPRALAVCMHVQMHCMGYNWR